MTYSVPGDRLLDLIRETSGPVVMVAPFVKTGAFQRVVSAIDEARPITLVTRWRVDEICAGVSDVDVWRVIEARGNSLMLLSNSLHAKYYRSEKSVLVGSANVTMQGLGWAARSNIELLERVEASPALISFENELIGSGTRVDLGLYEKYAAFKPEPKEPIDLAKNDELNPNLIPLSRNPDRLWGLYAAGVLSTNSVIDADSLGDLRMLAVPLGLSKEQFEGFVAMWLLSHPLGQRLDDYILIPRRFGEIRELVRDYGCVPGDDRDPTEIAQVMMRWMLHFFPERYELNQPRYSEIFSRRIG